MKISIITINYNNLSGLKDTVNSVISQTYVNIEYIVIDGGSKDGSAEYLRENGSKFSYWISEPDKGVYNAMNKGIMVSHGDYLIFMNSGDVFFNNKVLSNIFDGAEYDSDFLYGSTIYRYSENGLLRKPRSLEVLKRELPFCHQSVFVRGELMRKKLYNEEYKLISDYVFIYNCWTHGSTFFLLNKIVAIYDTTGISVCRSRQFEMYKELCTIHGKKASIADYCVLRGKYYTKSFLRSIIPSTLCNFLLHRDMDFNKLRPISTFKQF